MHRRTRGLLAAALMLVMILGPVGSASAILSGARSAVIGDDVFLEGTYLSVGISGTGSFGTSNAAPAGFHPSANYGGLLGLRYDEDGWDIGNDPTTGDFFVPGTPEERFVVGYKIHGVPSVFNNAETMGDYDIVRESFGNLSSGGTLKAEWVGLTQGFTVHFEDSSQPIMGNGSLPTVVQPIAAPTAHSEAAPSEDLPALRITQVVEFAYDQRSFKNTVTLQNAGSTALDSVRYMRNVDPDQDFDTYGDFYTRQPDHAPADFRRRGACPCYWPDVRHRAFLLFGRLARARVSTFGFTNMDPYDVAAYDHAGVYEWDGWTDANVYLSAKGSVTADQAITICADLGTIQPGQQQTFVYYTGFEAVPKYTIRASAGLGGTISPSGDVTVYQGASESFDVHADTGYSIAGVLVDGAPVSISSPTSMTYTFSNVGKNHTIARALHEARTSWLRSSNCPTACRSRLSGRRMTCTLS